MTEVLAIRVNSPSGMESSWLANRRLDVAKQQRGDLKETFNMARFVDPNWKQNVPEIIIKYWDEIVSFQKECYNVELKVLVLFALSLDVPIFLCVHWL
jgi:isopenicillin N synthase-like dioxygenase